MSTVEEIETAIENLKEDEFLRLAKWLETRLVDSWDSRIARDAEEGKLDFLFHEAHTERLAGELKEWPVSR